MTDLLLLHGHFKVYECLLTYKVVFPFTLIQIIQNYYTVSFLTSFMTSGLDGPKIVMHLEIRSGCTLTRGSFWNYSF